MKTRITELLGIEHPIFQAAMSWASSNAPLVIAVSNAGGMGVLGAGPMRPDDFRSVLDEIKAGTRKPFGVNIPLNGARAAELLEIAFRKKIPVMVASQGGPREQLPRFRAIGTKWLHVVASVEHAKKAEAAGVDALVVDGAEAGGHPPPSEVGTLVLVRRVVRATRLPVVASGGVADGAGDRGAARARRRGGAARHALHRHPRGERARELQARGAGGRRARHLPGRAPRRCRSGS